MAAAVAVAEAESAKKNPWCFMDISIDGELEGRIVVELFADVVPKAAENFRALCTGEKGISSISGKPLHYKDSRFHCISKGFMVLGGDICAGDGRGVVSIYGGNFASESFALKHEGEGILSMANYGPNTNGCQFFITTARASHLDGRNVVFGKVLKGMGVVRLMEHSPVVNGDRPAVEIKISGCGEIPEGSDVGVKNFFKDGDLYPDWPFDLDVKPDNVSWWMSAVESARTFGDYYNKKQNYKMALRKYQKTLRYMDACLEKEDIDEKKKTRLLEIRSEMRSTIYAWKLTVQSMNEKLMPKSVLPESLSTPLTKKARTQQET